MLCYDTGSYSISTGSWRRSWRRNIINVKWAPHFGSSVADWRCWIYDHVCVVAMEALCGENLSDMEYESVSRRNRHPVVRFLTDELHLLLHKVQGIKMPKT